MDYKEINNKKNNEIIYNKIDYETIYNKFLSKIDDPKLLSYEDYVLYEILEDYLTSTLAMPQIRKLFKTFEVNEDLEILMYELNLSYDEYTDIMFIIEVLTKGMVIQWMTQKLDTAFSLATMVGGKEEKMLRNEYKNNQERLRRLNVELKKFIRDSNYIDNTYTREEVLL